MTATITEIDQQVLDGLDFEHVAPCETDNHEPVFGLPLDPAAWVLEGYDHCTLAQTNSKAYKLLVCQRCVDYWVTQHWAYPGGDDTLTTRHDHKIIVLNLNPIRPVGE